MMNNLLIACYNVLSAAYSYILFIVDSDGMECCRQAPDEL